MMFEFESNLTGQIMCKSKYKGRHHPELDMTLRHSICVCYDTLSTAHSGLPASCGHIVWPIIAAINESLQINAVIITRESVAEQAKILFVFNGSATRFIHTVF